MTGRDRQTSGAFRQLGIYSDWVTHAGTQARLYPGVDEPGLTSAEVRALLGFRSDGLPLALRQGRRWTREGVTGEEVSWSVGYGPRTEAWLLRPEKVDGPLPGVLALHGHDGFKFFGKEKVADGPDGAPPAVAAIRAALYEGVAFANDLARSGFSVLVHDVFLWGSRRFPAELLQPPARAEPETQWIGEDSELDPGRDIVAYNHAALSHEHLVAKYCTLLGTSLAGVIAYEDRIAVQYLRSRRDIVAGPIGCIGLSGGGGRAALLQATCEHVSGAVIVGMMTAHPALFDRLVANHTWMFFPPGLACFGDWPDIAAARAPTPLLVQFNRDDELFTLDGMSAAHERLAARYRQAGAAEAYVGEFYAGRHKFNRAMQRSAFEHLKHWLRD
jgi:dienelactone hydrolase